VAVDDRLSKIRNALAKHAPTIEFVSRYESPGDHDRVLEPPHVDDSDLIEDALFIGRYLSFRIVALSDGAFALVAFDVDLTESPRVMLRHEWRWQTVVWFVHLLELNRVRSVWWSRPVYLKDRSGQTVLTIA
jgi:hypothetical protein